LLQLSALFLYAAHSVSETGPLLKLNCLVLGDSRKNIFTVQIPPADNVSALKDAIKEKNQNRFQHIDAHALELWRAPVHLRADADEIVQEALNEFELNSDLSLKPLWILHTRFVGISDEKLHVIVVPPSTGEYHCLLAMVPFMLYSAHPKDKIDHEGEERDVLTELRLRNVARRPTKPPSDGAKLSIFAKDQLGTAHVECGRPRPKDMPVPLALLFKPFGSFRDDFRTGTPDAEIASYAYDMAMILTNFFDEEKRRIELLKLLSAVLNVDMHRIKIRIESAKGTYITDGGVQLPLNELQPPMPIIVEVKKEGTEGSSDAHFELVCYYHENIRFVLELKTEEAKRWKQTRLPSILLSHAGMLLQVLRTVADD
jgi:hypothetical protein